MLGQGSRRSPTTSPAALQPTSMAIQHKMSPSKGPEQDQMIINMPAVCTASATTARPPSMPLTWCTATLANKRTHSLEQQDKEQPWVVLSEEKEEGGGPAGRGGRASVKGIREEVLEVH